MTMVETHFFILLLVKGEERSWEATVTPISSQDSKRFLLKHSFHYILKTYMYVHQLHNV